MEGTPKGLDVSRLERVLLELAPIEGVHDMHVWCLNDKTIAASLHVRVAQANLDDSPTTVAAVKALLRKQFDIEHCTVEVECDDCKESC